MVRWVALMITIRGAVAATSSPPCRLNFRLSVTNPYHIQHSQLLNKKFKIPAEVCTSAHRATPSFPGTVPITRPRNHRFSSTTSTRSSTFFGPPSLKHFVLHIKSEDIPSPNGARHCLGYVSPCSSTPCLRPWEVFLVLAHHALSFRPTPSQTIHRPASAQLERTQELILRPESSSPNSLSCEEQLKD